MEWAYFIFSHPSTHTQNNKPLNSHSQKSTFLLYISPDKKKCTHSKHAHEFFSYTHKKVYKADFFFRVQYKAFLWREKRGPFNDRLFDTKRWNI